MSQPELRQGVSQPISTDAELERYRKQQLLEWGVWIADPDGPGIFIDNVLAYAPGHSVPVSNVQKYGYDKDGQVVKRVPDKEAPPDSGVLAKKK